MNAHTAMHRTDRIRLTSIALATALLAPLAAQATNGYFSAGHGIKAQGIAGIGVALPQDGLTAAANPAGTALVGNRMDLGLTVFAPRRDAEITGNAFGADAQFSGNDKKTFLIPDLGYTRQLDGRTGVGLAVYGNGGMNTDYGTNPYGRFGATGATGVNLEQLFIAPSVAHKVSEQHTLGASLVLAHQRFAAKGVGLFSGFSSAPGQVSDQGTDSSNGVGLRLGWIGQLTPQVTVGASWASKINGRFDRYKGLFPNGGEFDIPESMAVGLSYAATPQTTLAAEVQHIRYRQVAAVGNSSASLFAGQPLGSANGPGFGWDNATVLKIGAQHQVNKALTLRGGFSVVNQPVSSGETFINTLAPGVVRKHLTVGATWAHSPQGELSVFFAHAFGERVRGSNSIPGGMPPAGFGGGNSNVGLRENIFGIAYGWKL